MNSIRPFTFTPFFRLPPSSSSSSSSAATPLRSFSRFRAKASIYSQLAKSRLTFLVVLTSMAGYALSDESLSCASSSSESSSSSSSTAGTSSSPTASSFTAGSSTARPSANSSTTSWQTLTTLAIGTGLCAASANALNQVIEVPLDGQMMRTRLRPLVLKRISPLHAVLFAAVCGITGTAALASINAETAALGAGTIALYAFAYTPMKRLSTWNTALGAVVGALPPLMGYTASRHPHKSIWFSPQAYVTPALVAAWQFPHFYALAYNIRQDYARAGYRMLVVCSPLQAARTSLLFSLAFFPICAAYGPAAFAIAFLPNVIMTRYSVAFHRAIRAAAADAAKKEAKNLFRFSLGYLPVVLVGAIVAKSWNLDEKFGLKKYQLLGES